GEYRWGGFWYTDFFIDPKEELIGIIMAQLHPTGGLRLHELYKVAVYQSIVD
ncbi:MAG: serine hydrolase, partial [bacterium]|nr:serine hydrolase [bacterium]